MSSPSTKLRIPTFAVVVVVSAATGVGVPVDPAVAAANASITADSAIPGATATHRVTVHASADEVGNSLSSVRVNYHADGSYDGSVQDVGVDDVRRVGIDTDDDGDIEVSVADDLESVEAKNVGETLLFNFGGSYGLHAGDSVVVVFDDATNPTSAGEYTVEVDLSVQSSADPASTTLTVGTVTNETLRNATWTNASVDGAVIENGTISDARIANVTWTNGTTVNTTWTNVTVDDTRLNGSEMTNVSLSNSTLSNATVENVTITDGALSNVTFTNATFTNVTIVDGRIRNVTFENATFECVAFADANRRGDGAKRSYTGRTTDEYRVEKSTRERRNRGSEPQRC